MKVILISTERDSFIEFKADINFGRESSSIEVEMHLFI
jgi:hypothetical protein